MKTFLTISLILLWQFSYSQIQQIEHLEQDLRGTSGTNRVDILLSLTDAYMLAGELSKAEKSAEDAGDLARRLKSQDLRALALNKEGKVMVARGKRKSGSKFEQSLDILRDIKSTDKALALDNLENLRSLAQKAERHKELASLEAQITYLRNGGNIADEVPDATEALQVLNAAQKKFANDRNQLKENQSKLLAESQALQQELAARESLIEQMSAEQMKTAMVLMEQKNLLDSVTYKSSLDSMTVSNANLALREAESNRKFNYTIIGILFLLALLAVFGYIRVKQNARVLAEKNKTIREEQARSENLLLNILPSIVAEELKRYGKTKAQYFEDVSVLFADFVGFSNIAEKLSPQQLVSELDTCFQKFDNIVAKYQLEKIKTIGDAYMCAGGIPGGDGAHMASMVNAAFEMQQWLDEWNAERDKKKIPRFDARIGIHRGPVVAGVVGSKKFAFDIWGDTVNIAARIEQAGEGGRINISGAVYSHIKDNFNCLYRGKIAAKNKGEIDMYFVEN